MVWGAGEGEILGAGAKIFANGIGPNIEGDIDDGFFGTEDVVVEAHFPKTGGAGFLELKGGTQFEDADEFEQVAGGDGAFCEEMKMIGHEAIGVEKEGAVGGGLQQSGGDVAGGVLGGEMRFAEVAADGDEMGELAAVVFRRGGGRIYGAWALRKGVYN